MTNPRFFSKLRGFFFKLRGFSKTQFFLALNNAHAIYLLITIAGSKKMNKMALMSKMVLSLLCFILCLSRGTSIMPSYIPVTSGNSDRNSLIECYFNLGLDYSEILSFLLLVHGIQLSIRQLKRVLFSKGLRRRRNHSQPQEIIAAIQKESLKGPVA